MEIQHILLSVLRHMNYNAYRIKYQYMNSSVDIQSSKHDQFIFVFILLCLYCIWRRTLFFGYGWVMSLFSANKLRNRWKVIFKNVYQCNLFWPRELYKWYRWVKQRNCKCNPLVWFRWRLSTGSRFRKIDSSWVEKGSRDDYLWDFGWTVFQQTKRLFRKSDSLSL